MRNGAWWCGAMLAWVLVHPLTGKTQNLMPPSGGMESSQSVQMATRSSTLATRTPDPLPRPIAPLPHGEGARRMGQRLRAFYDQTDWKADPNKAAERIPYYQMVLSHPLAFADEMAVRMELANEQLRVGLSARAVETLEDLLKRMEAHAGQIPTQVQARVWQQLGISYLRLAEQENCVGLHNALSCNFPLHGAGLHQRTRGAEGAIRAYTRTLELEPENWLARWLMNIAYQALGHWPEAVPKQWLARPELFASENEIGYFPEIASIAGLTNMELSGGALIEDFDGDGLLDILVSSSGPLDAMHFYHNNGDGTFSDRTKQAGLGDEVGGLNLVLTDYNNDGRPDVLVLRGAWWGRFGMYPLSLLRNNGDGTFDDVTEEAGLLVAGPTQTAAWADYDNDGWLDLFVAHESKPGDEHLCQLFHNNHDGTFSEVSAPGAAPGSHIGSNLGFVKGVGFGDYNNDGRPDLYVAAMNGPGFLYRNDGPLDAAHAGTGEWKWTDVTEKAGLGGSRNSFPTWFFDYDNDGWLDLFVGGYGTTSMQDVGAFELGLPHHGSVSHLYRNQRDGTFHEEPRALGLDRAVTVMAANFGDLDNDGWLDVYLGLGESSYESLLPKRMFRNRQGRAFEDVTTSGGFGNLQKGHGIAFADVDNSGQEDVLEELGGAFPGDQFMPTLYQNPGHAGHWITLKLEGVQTNRIGYGARIRVRFSEAGQSRSVYRAVGSVSSFGGNPFRQHIGVGQATVIDELEVWWPTSGQRQILHAVAVDRAYRLREGAEGLEPLELPRFVFGKTKVVSGEPMMMHHP